MGGDEHGCKDSKMPPEVQARMQGRVDGLCTAYSTFVSSNKRKALKLVNEEIKELSQLLALDLQNSNESR